MADPVNPHHSRWDVTRAPMMCYWELTRACDLACRHCRAEAQADRHPDELSTDECLRVVDQLLQFGDPLPHVVITGGDPLKRSDLWEVIRALRRAGFQVAITPSGTYALSESVVERFRQEGIWMVSMSLDGSDGARHDGIRQVPGAFDQTLRAMHWCRQMGLPMQINTLVCQETLDDLLAIHALVAECGAARWSPFFLIQVGRGRGLSEITPGQSEEVCQRLIEQAETHPMVIKTTELPHYRRVVLQCTPAGSAARTQIRRGLGIRDGCGILFISHLGDLYPSGFLPVTVGSVRLIDPVQAYRTAPLLRRLRDSSLLRGKCGLCEFRDVCGGSRARAWAHTGDVMAADPMCPYLSQAAAEAGLGSSV